MNDPTPFSFIGIAYYETDAGGTVIRNILASDVAAKGQAVRVVRVVARASPPSPDGSPPDDDEDDKDLDDDDFGTE